MTKPKIVAPPDPYHTNAEVTFVSSAARTMFVLQWADYEEACGRTYPGKDLMDVAPTMPHQFLREGWRFLGAVEIANRKSLHAILAAAAKADGCDADDIDVDSFAHYCIMQAVGHGVSWFDNHKEFELRLPMWQIIELDEDKYPLIETKPSRIGKRKT